MRQWYLRFNPKAYGPEVAAILNLEDDGERLIPLVASQCSSEAAKVRLQAAKASGLFPKASVPEGALAGLWLYFSCFEESHEIAQNIGSPEGSLWHGILHRQEPDSGNAAYWFRRAGVHPIFAPLCSEADAVIVRYPEAEFRTGGRWDPYSFIMFCERARQQPGSSQERAALEIQRAEWQLLFDYCARAKT